MKLVSSLNIKGAVLDKNQLNQYLEQIASDHILQNKTDKTTYPIPRLEENFAFITKTYQILTEHLKMGFFVHPAGEWLLDNYYIIEEAYQQIKKNLDKKKYTSFLGLSNGMYKGYARIYVLAAEIVAYTDGQIEEENLKNMLASYQNKKKLNMEEIWNIGIFFLIALIEKIRNICEKIYYSQIQKYKAESMIERLVERKEKDKLVFKQNKYKEQLNVLEQMKYPFIEHLSYRLKKYGKQAIPYLAILEEQVNKLGLTTSEVIQKEHFDIAIKKVSIGNCIKSIKEIQRMDMQEIFEQINGVEEILKKDPAGVYAKMDYSTKEHYRGEIKELAKKTKISEVYIAKKLLELANKNAKKGKKQAHIGYYLIDEGIDETINALEIKKKSLTKSITQKVKNKKITSYINSICILAAIFTLLCASGVYISTKSIVFSIIIAILIYIPLTEIFVQLIQYILGKIVKPKHIPKMDYQNGIPEDKTTMVVIPTIVDSQKKAKELVQKLEVFYLANKSENIYFTLLGDCSSEQKEVVEKDSKIQKTALEEIQKLNEKYNNNSFPIFNFIYRNRSWNKKENCFLGWERKRGLLAQFNEYLINKINEKQQNWKMPFGKEFKINTIQNWIQAHKEEKLPTIKYIITLDADTDLVLDSGLELVGAMGHILNKPILNKEKTVVIKGHALMQPRVGIHLEASRKSKFSKIFGGLGGTDSYTNAISDTYQDNFGEGIFTGKGIYDLEVFEEVLKKAIPENTVLSHDLLEGNYLRCALVSDILLMDGYPSKYNAFMNRLHRWIRGDWQIIMWLKKKVKVASGDVQKNPLSKLSRFKIIDNLRRSLIEISIILSLFVAVAIKQIYSNAKIGSIILVDVITIFMPTILEIADRIIYKKDGQKKQKTFEKKLGNIGASFIRGILAFGSCPYKAYMSFDAICRTIYRTTVSKKHLLEWTTSEEAEKLAKDTVSSYYIQMFFNVVIGILAIIVGIVTKNIFLKIILLLFGICWCVTPIVMQRISKEEQKTDRFKELNKEEQEYLLEVGKRTWEYFSIYMNKDNNFLPPDNYQEDRKQEVVDRTSSTNIGLGLLCIVSAFDLNLIQKEELMDRLEQMLMVIDKLPKWNGHLYNWYNIKTLEPLLPRYVSTVDSGNLLGYLYTLRQFLLSFKQDDRIKNMLNIIDRIIEQTDFKYLYDEKKRLFSIGFDVEENKLTNSYYDLLASEARQASFIAIAKKDVSPKHWNNLSRTLTILGKYKGLISWSGTAFEYLMPNINITHYEGSLLDESSRFLIMCQEKYAQKLGTPWGISEAAFSLKDLNGNYQYKAFGVPWLGLKRGLDEEMVVAPYASILAILEQPKKVVQNLKILEKQGLYDKYGFYESIDFTPYRISNGKNANLVKTYMAHHQALILLSINNLFNKNVLERRFMENPEIRAIDILLQERMPEDIVITKQKKERVEKIKYKAYPSYTQRVYTKFNPNIKYTNIISNGSYTVGIDEKGTGFSQYKDILVNRYKNTSDYAQGILFFFKNIRSKRIWTSGMDFNLVQPDKCSVIYSPERSAFVRQDENIETKTKVIVSQEEAVEIRQIELSNFGTQEETIEVSSMMEPVLSKKEQDYAHMAFNNLFLKYEQIENSASILVKRNKRGDSQDIYLATNLCSNPEYTIGDLEYEIDKEKLYEGGEVKIPKKIEDSKPFSKSLGLAVNPTIAMRKTVKIMPGKSVILNFIVAVSENKEEVKANIKKYENEENVNLAFELSKARVEEETRYLGITGEEIEVYQKILTYLVFQNGLRSANKVAKAFHQSDLWKYGISGDLPILMVEIKEVSDSYIIEEVLKAYEYFRVKNIFIDLVIMLKEENIYEQYLKQSIYRQVENRNLSYLQNTSGGIFILNENEMEDKDILKTRANLLLYAKDGNLKNILEDQEAEYLESVPNMAKEKIEIKPLPVFEENHPNIDMEKLKYYNSYGGFSEDGKEYIIKVNKNNKTPTVWSHVMANEKFGTLVTSNLGGFTWSNNSRLNRLTAWSNDSVIDAPSEIIYLRDSNIDKTWSLGVNPMPDDNDYYITFGFGYANVYHSSFGLIQNQEIFVPKEDTVKINKITLRNTMPMKRKIKLVYYVKPVLGEDEIQTNSYINMKFNKTSNLLTFSNLYENDISKVMYISSSETIESFTGRKEEFIGRRTISNPEGMENIHFSNDNTLDGQRRIAVEFTIELESFETKEIVLMLGEAINEFEAQNMSYKYSKMQNVTNEQEGIKKYWNEVLGRVQVETPVESTNILLNGWISYQTIVCRLWAKSAFYQSGGAFGFRDQLQDTLGIKYLSDELMRKQIIEHSKHQFTEGDVEHWWHKETNRGIRTRFSDDLLWLVYVTIEYIHFTNSYDILDIETPFIQGELLQQGEDERYELHNQSDKKASIYVHLTKAIDKSLDFGENRLPKIGSGDWNDGMNTVGNKGKGESVWLGFFLYTILENFIPICKRREDNERADRYEEIKNNLKKTLNTIAWDGRWYRRAFTDDGDILGSIENEECRIDSIAQSWSVISKAGDNDKKYIAMESLENHLIDKENGIIKLLDPPFEKGKLEPGYIKAYLPGVRENGGQYTHAAIWTVIAFSMLGMGEKAFEYFKMINPIEHARTRQASQKYKVEPYVVAADIYSVSNLQGRGGWTWYTGSSSWLYKAGIEYILGLKIEDGFLTITPSIPSNWKEYTIKYRYKNTLYYIKVKNPNGKNGLEIKMKLNGEPVEDKKVRLLDDGKIYEIDIELI